MCTENKQIVIVNSKALLAKCYDQFEVSSCVDGGIVHALDSNMLKIISSYAAWMGIHYYKNMQLYRFIACSVLISMHCVLWSIHSMLKFPINLLSLMADLVWL